MRTAAITFNIAATHVGSIVTAADIQRSDIDFFYSIFHHDLMPHVQADMRVRRFGVLDCCL
jgi:hypothetical protein